MVCINTVSMYRVLRMLFLATRLVYCISASVICVPLSRILLRSLKDWWAGRRNRWRWASMPFCFYLWRMTFNSVVKLHSRFVTPEMESHARVAECETWTTLQNILNPRNEIPLSSIYYTYEKEWRRVQIFDRLLRPYCNLQKVIARSFSIFY